jgi:hypothetical protein
VRGNKAQTEHDGLGAYAWDSRTAAVVDGLDMQQMLPGPQRERDVRLAA